MKYGSICSGIASEAVAWKDLGWECKFHAEIDPFCCKLLRSKYPTIPNLGDITKIDPTTLPDIDLIVGGTPCQSFSTNTLNRGGLLDARGRLSRSFVEIVAITQPRWVIWENVPGALSANGGAALGSFLWNLAEWGYGWAYRVLDLRGFGIPQRRRRLFVVGCLGDCARAIQALFDTVPKGSNGTAPREGRKESVAGATRRVDGWIGDTTPRRSSNCIPTLRSQQGGEGIGVIDETGRLRHLTITEYERCQGFPDGYTNIGRRGEPSPTKSRQRAIGNSFPPPILRWIGERIQKIEEGYSPSSDS